jgi:hypothetical protein
MEWETGLVAVLTPVLSAFCSHPWLPRSVFYPSRVIHRLCKGVANSYNTHGGIARGVEVHTAYQLPVSPPVPIDVQYLETVSPQVPVGLWTQFAIVCGVQIEAPISTNMCFNQRLFETTCAHS